MQPLVEKYKPQLMADFAGLDRSRAILGRFASEPYNSAWLFLGSAGTGKTTMAFALAKEIGGEVHHIPSRNCDLAAVDQIAHTCRYIPFSGQWHVVIVDEADQMTRAAQLAFLSKLDGTAAPPNTVFVFTANDTRLLEKRFLSRCRTLPFEHNGDPKPAAAFLLKVWRSEAPGIAPPDLAQLLQDSEYNLRDALMRLELELIAPAPAPKPVPAPTPIPADILADPVKLRRWESVAKGWATRRAKLTLA